MSPAHRVKSLARRIDFGFGRFGISPLTSIRNAWGVPYFLRNKREIQRQYQHSGKEFPFSSLYPCLGDRFESGGVTSGHYFHQDLHVAQLIHARQPERHVDVASRIDGFVAHVASFVPVEVLDIRPAATSARNITFRQTDLMQVPFALTASTSSLSCLHGLEHFGLGRYGDPVDYDGYRTAWEHLTSMVTAGGFFYFSVPIGSQRIEFDAHRVFSVPFLMETMIEPSFSVASFAFVDDAGEIHFDEDPRSPAAAVSFGCRYGCGIFELIKNQA